LFDVYGGHLRARGGAATVAALVRLLEPLGIAAPAVRTAVSRMVRQGWLRPVRLPGGAGYALTRRAELRLDEAGARIYRTRPSTWDGRWHVVILDRAPARAEKDRLASSLQLLGYGPLGPATWIAPRPSAELAALLDVEQVVAHTFHGRHGGDDTELAAAAWDLAALDAGYADFVRLWSANLSGVDVGDEPAAFATSQLLLHDWRKFLFRDPGLPPELLPTAWMGAAAAEFFDLQTARLAPAATRFVDACLRAERNATIA
jgi:phenylacetic acid degradation operon negative regulatory protein